MPWIDTSKLKQGEARADTLQLYNGLDCCVTLEVFEEIIQTYGDVLAPGRNESTYYDFSRSLQGPILDIMQKGFKVDQYEKRKGLGELDTQIEHLDRVLSRMAFAVWGKELNPNSHVQLKSFFYGCMQLPEQWISEKGERKLSFKREVLEKLEIYLYARPICATIMALRDQLKLKQILLTEIDPDGRMRTSYNIAGTETGRLSSSANAFGTGGNLQNIPPDLRRIFIADDGWKLCVIDYEQSEARDIGFAMGIVLDDWVYLDNCESGDLHTNNCILCWPELPWPGDAKGNRLLADEIFYRDFTRRDMLKRGGHGKNYYGTDWTIARFLKVPVEIITAFSTRYFAANPGIPRWHRWTAEQVQTKQQLTTPFGLTRHFFGRPDDDTTLREAIAFQGQSPTATRTNLALLRHWEDLRGRTQLLGQTHDSITFQYRESDNEAEVINKALKLMEIALRAPNGREFVIPGEAKIGWNWGNHHNTAKPTGTKNRFNPNGLQKWKGQDLRQRLVGLERPA